MTRKRTRPALDLSRTSEHEVLVEGVKARVLLDANGRLLTVSAQYWDDLEVDAFGNPAYGPGRMGRLAKLAVELTVKEFKAAQDHRTRLASSLDKKRENAKNHWSNQWLAKAREKDPDCGAQDLSRLARQLHAVAYPDPASAEYARRPRSTSTAPVNT